MDIERLLNLIAGILGGLAVTALLIYLVLLYVWPAKKRRITIVKKRITPHWGLTANKSREICTDHCTVDCTADASGKVRTYGCEKKVFDQLRVGGTYEVSVRLMQIERLHRKSS